MVRRVLAATLAALCIALCAPATRAEEPATKFTWDLSVIYPSDQAWNTAKNDLAKRADQIALYKGKLGSSAQELKAGLDLVWGIREELYRLEAYASQKSDLDISNAKALAMRQAMTPLEADISAKMAWVDPEILEIPQETIARFQREEPGLAKYEPVLKDILRQKAHTLSAKEEKILSDAQLLSDIPDSVYTVLSDAEIPRPTITLTDGTSVRLDAAAYTQYRAVPDRWDRERVFDAFFGNLHDFRGTFGALLNSECKRDLFVAKARHYLREDENKSRVGDTLASALDGPNIPTAVYTNLIQNVHKNLPVLHRYLKLRRRMMGLDQLRYSDLYASIIKEVDQKYSADDAMGLVLNAVAPLGKDYVETLRDGYFNERWVDMFPSRGKHSGAYSNGAAYGVHPFMLLNYNGSYEDVSTLAHESGHAMHSFYSNKTQPFCTSDYTTFVAEVASTFNEHLLMDYMLKNTNDDRMKLFLLGSYVDNIRQTLFRQTQFAEFELKIHRLAENGEALTGDKLDQVYKGILDDYYGTKEGLVAVNPVCYSEWAYIPHFYYNYYVFTYATSITASTALSQMVIDGKPGAVEAYRKFLTLGNSKPPIDELKIAGVDMTTSAPFDVTMRSMNDAMDQMETILNRMEKANSAAAKK